MARWASDLSCEGLLEQSSPKRAKIKPALVEVKDLRFTHRIANHFGWPETRSFQQLVSDLNEGHVISHAADFLRLELFEWRGEFFSINNRRTYCLWRHQVENPMLDVRVRPWKVHWPTFVSPDGMPRYDTAVDDLFRRMFSSTTFGREVRIGGQPNQTFRIPVKAVLLPRIMPRIQPQSICQATDEEDEDVVKKELGLKESHCPGVARFVRANPATKHLPGSRRGG